MSKIDNVGDQPTAAAAFVSVDSNLQNFLQNDFLQKTDKTAPQSSASVSARFGSHVVEVKASANEDVHSILGNFSIEGQAKVDPVTVKATEQMLNTLSKNAYQSTDAATVVIANKLAADPALAKLLTDQAGHITKSTVESLRLADAGVLLDNHGAHHPLTRVLSDKQRADLDFIVNHENVLSGQGIGKDALTGASTSQLAKIFNGKQPVTGEQFAAKGAAEIHSVPTEHGPKVAYARTSDQAPLNTDDFSAAAKRVLAKIDTAHTGAVTKEQLAKAMQDPSIKGADAQALVAMYHNFDRLHNLSGHEGWLGAASITNGDLDKFQSINKSEKALQGETSDMKQWAHMNLQKFTESGSDKLTRGDIERALNNPKTSEYDRDMLKLVQKHYSEMGTWYLPGVNVKDFDDFDKNAHNDANAKLISGVYGSCYSVAKDAQSAGTEYGLYGGRDAIHSITADGVRQGAIGDCYYESVVAAVAKNDPALIRDAIKDNHNGTYTVTFPGAKNEPITVQAPTEADLGLYNRGSQNGVWASVLEKAYGQYRRNHGASGYTPEEGADGGGRPEPVISLLTGHDSTWTSMDKTNPAELAKNLEAAFASNPPKAVVSGINSDARWRELFGLSTPTTGDRFYKDHEYTITGFRPDGHGGGTVIVRNPWGGQDCTVDGTIEIPLAEYMKNFSDVTIQK